MYYNKQNMILRSDLITRRRLIAGSAGAMVALSGCSVFSDSDSDSDISLSVTIQNITDEQQEAHIDFNNPDEPQKGVVAFSERVDAGKARRLEFSIPPGTYEMEFVVDDVTPRPERTVEWEVTEDEDECERTRHCVISPAETGLHPRVLKMDCENRNP